MELRLTDAELKKIVEELAIKLLPLLKEQLNANDELLTFQEACNFLKCKRSWLYKKVQLGEVPYVKMGKYLRFSRKELDKWVCKKLVISRGCL